MYNINIEPPTSSAYEKLSNLVTHAQDIVYDIALHIISSKSSHSEILF